MRLAKFRHLCVLLMPLVVFSQEKPLPPPDVDKALRDRAGQFLQFTVDRSYRKAYDLVAEETKDWYLSSGKPQYASLIQIEGIEYAKDFQEATVKSRVVRVLAMNGRETSTELVVSDLWRMIDGKWMWYHDPDILETPFGPVKIDRSKASANPGSSPVPKDMSPAAALSAVKGLTIDASTDKKTLVFKEGRPGSDEIVFRNSLQGPLVVEADVVGDYVAFSVEPMQAAIPAGKEFVFKVHYKPSPRPEAASLRFSIQPFNRNLMVPLLFEGTPTPAVR